MNKIHLFIFFISFLALLLITVTHPALAAPPAHEAPTGSEWVMADWMFLSFGLFAGVGMLAFLIALKLGLLSNIEEAKYYLLEIEEEDDYYIPDWIRSGGGS
ncbi:MAG: hypothetical protein A2Z27_04875 [candidate division Zixibacteria bacterium RBG_16_50_21]|nr:MAG: hypothetical protein A2Z27_04875 [candidate division Zixibacteria bacterium RBG_16_50_21]